MRTHPSVYSVFVLALVNKGCRNSNISDLGYGCRNGIHFHFILYVYACYITNIIYRRKSERVDSFFLVLLVPFDILQSAEYLISFSALLYLSLQKMQLWTIPKICTQGMGSVMQGHTPVNKIWNTISKLWYHLPDYPLCVWSWTNYTW